MGTTKERKRKAVVEVVEIMGSGHQPTKAEMEEDISVDLSPEDLARLMMRDVEARQVNPKRVDKG